MNESFRRCGALSLSFPSLAALIASGAFLAACGTRPNPLSLWEGDSKPPCVLSLAMDGEDSIVLTLDEPGAFVGEGPLLYDAAGSPLALDAGEGSGRSTGLRLRSAGSLSPGAEYRLEGRVEDAEGNSQAFLLPLWGFNPRPARLLINEVRTVSSSPKCDLVELYSAGAGNCAGLCLSSGDPADPDWTWTLPPIEIAAGDYLVLHLKAPEGTSPLDDIAALDLASGPDCGAEWRDLWYPGAAGLPSANGCLSLCSSPGGPFLDALCYSERTSSSDATYGGFGTAKFREAVKALAAAGAWKAAAEPIPEDCASSAGTTETRSLCRNSSSADSDGRGDWHVAPTKGATWGGANLDAAYLPQAARRR